MRDILHTHSCLSLAPPTQTSVEVHFDQSMYTVNETEGIAILTVQARGDTSQGFTVTVNTLGDTATREEHSK